VTRRDRGGIIRLGMFTGSPIPCKMPIYRLLGATTGIDFTAVYASSGGVRPVDEGFAVEHAWDVDLLSGYRSLFLERADRSPALGASTWSVYDPDIIRVLVRERFDALWLDGYNSVSYLLAVATQRMLGGHVIFREEQTLLHPRSLAVTITKEIALRRLFRGHHALYVSSENRRWFEHYGVPAERLFSAPHTVDNDFFRTAAERLRSARSMLRERFGIGPDDGPVILTASRLVEKKQPLFLLEAFRRVRSERECALLVAGSGPLESHMRGMVERDGIPDVHFAGFLNQTEMPSAYACADVFALLSREHETFGLVVPEAMNFALPLVVSDKVGCHADLVSRGLNGYVVSHVDPDEAAAALRRLVTDEDLRRRMGAASLVRLNEWTPQHTADGVLAAVRHVSDGHRR
jgi:glycosyltransferase involved in cell wall biosynthesis